MYDVMMYGSFVQKSRRPA